MLMWLFGDGKPPASPEKLLSEFGSLGIKNKSSEKRRSNSNSKDGPPQKRSSTSDSSSSETPIVPATTQHLDVIDNSKTVISAKDKMMNLPQKPAYGKLGRKSSVRVNCFRVHCKTSQVSLYQIEFEPPLPADSNILKQSHVNKIKDKLQDTFGVFIFNGLILVALKKVVESPIVFKIDNENMIEIKFIKSVDLKNAPYEEFSQLIHIIFQKATRSSNLVRIGRNHYDKTTLENENFTLWDDRIRLFRGYSLSIEQSLDGLFLTCDISHRVISTCNMAETIDGYENELKGGFRQGGGNQRGRQNSNFGGDKRGSRDSYGSSSSDDRIRNNTNELIKHVEEEVLGRSVITIYRMRNWRIDEIDWSQNIDSTFVWRTKDGTETEISYRDYFFKNYRLKLVNTRYGMLINLPKVRNGKSRRKGPDRFVLPPECCYMTGLSKKMKGDFRLMKRIRDRISLNPKQRFNAIENMAKQLSTEIETDGSGSRSTSSSERSNPSREAGENYLKIEIEPRALSCDSRILPDVDVTLKGKQGSMKVRMKDLMRQWTRAGFVNSNPFTVSRWVLMHETRYHKQATAMVNELMKNSETYRLLKTPLDVFEVNVNPRGNTVFNVWKEKIEEVMKMVKGLQLIVVVLPSHFRSDDVYSAVKAATLLHRTKLIPTQCIKAQRFDQRGARALPSVIGSTLKQILTKRGNIPWIVNFNIVGKFNPFNKKTMVCGIDVNHDMKRNRATAGICMSGDSRFSRYETFVSTGKAGIESIQGAEKCMIKSILTFANENGHLPEHIIVYRDGVSNSELVKVLNTEVDSFKKAFKHKAVRAKIKPGSNYKPKLTFVVVQKRVSLRIFSPQFESGSPGTVVDSGIVSSRFWDFYMLTTRAPPGKTARPTRYIVIHDDFGLKNDELQSFTNQLCHTYYNFPGPIRVPAPVQIAHQVAYLFGTIIATSSEKAVFTPMCKGKAYYL